MPKKRRLTTDQARLLALRYIQVALTREAIHAMDNTPSPYGMASEYFSDVLPAKWGDGQTSNQSWEHIVEEAEIQLRNIMDCFSEEAKRIVQENPEFRYHSKVLS